MTISTSSEAPEASAMQPAAVAPAPLGTSAAARLEIVAILAFAAVVAALTAARWLLGSAPRQVLDLDVALTTAAISSLAIAWGALRGHLRELRTIDGADGPRA